ncbi:hypothetical protein ACFLZJ_01385 [Nanoarchaeota archaeon]
MKKNTKMNAKNLMVFFLAAMFAISMISAVSWSGDLADDIAVKVDGMYVNGDDIAVIAGDDLTVKVYFTAMESDSDVTVEAEVEGEKVDFDAITSSFDVEEDKKYSRSLTLRVPFELKDEVSDNLELRIEIDGKEFKTNVDDIILRVQRPTYNAEIMSVSTLQSVEAGETFPVDLVLKNRGYNDLDDLYVTASIPALGVQRSGYFGDLVAIEDCDDDCDDDDEDTVSGRLYLKVPYDVKAGVYSLEVEVENSDTSTTVSEEITIENAFSNGPAIASGDDILLVNPTNNVVVYRVVPESTTGLAVTVDPSMVAVPAGSSKTVSVSATSSTEGTYTYSVNVFSADGKLVDTITFTKTVSGGAVANPIVVLTVILAIIFIVLLIVLIVLIGKKPETTEEFGESYY